MKVLYKNNLYEVLDIYIENYPQFILNGKQYESSIYVAVRTKIGTFEVNGKSKPYNAILNSQNITKDYFDRLCNYSGKLKIVYETILENTFFKPIINN